MARGKKSSEFAALRDQLDQLSDLVERYRSEKDVAVAAEMVTKARDFISRASEATSRAAEHSVDAVMEAGRDMARAATAGTSEALDEFEATVGRHPITTVLAAAGVGLMLGMLMRRD